MREAAESIDDRLVRQRVARPVLVPQLTDEADRERLILTILAVLEGEVKKESYLRRHRGIESVVDGTPRKLARNGIGGEGARGASEHVARELIHDDHGREQRS